MNKITAIIASNSNIAERTYEMKLVGEFSDEEKPGRFVNILIPGCYLRRPVSVCDKKDDVLTIVYKTVGRGTEILSEKKVGETLDVLTGLGNGFDLSLSGKRPLLLGGGAGVSPLYFLAEKLSEKGVSPVLAAGFNTVNDCFYESKFKEICEEVHIVTADGSSGEKGFVTDVTPLIDYTYFYACGPFPMYKTFEKQAKTSGEYSLEERMGCGFGVCMGCSIETKNGMKRICKEGPVFKREEIIW